MLLEFKVRNYRSICDEQVVSLVASPDDAHELENTFATGLKNPARALRTAAIYGANASGKTNVLRALLIMRAIVTESAQLKPDQPLNVQSFRLNESQALQPTLFEATILLDGIRHQYGFEATAERITREWLLVYKSARPQTWIDRRYDSTSDGDVYEPSNYLQGPKQVWQEATRSNALLLSTAVQLNSESLAPLHRWFQNNLVVNLDGGFLPPMWSTQALTASDKAKSLGEFMRSADIAIDSIAAVTKPGVVQREIQFDLATGQATSRQVDGDVLFPVFTHRVGDVSAEFELHDESLGTQKLFSLSAPLMDMLSQGMTLVIDELDRSLHPLLLRQIINTFHDPDRVGQVPQLLFSTHDTSLLDSSVLRRDQVWFTEKGRDQATRIVPLSDFSPRKHEAFERGYLGGRYGAVPILDERLKARVRGKK